MGNVAADIMRWLLETIPDRQTEEVIVVARRGPYEAKFDKKEIEHVEEYIPREDFLRELDRIRETCEACNQDLSPEKLGESTFPFLKKSFPRRRPAEADISLSLFAQRNYRRAGRTHRETDRYGE